MKLHAIVRVRLMDLVAAVIAAAMPVLVKLKEIWSTKGEIELEKDVEAMFMSVKENQNLIVMNAWKEAWGQQQSLPRMANSILPKLSMLSGTSEEKKMLAVVTMKTGKSFQTPVRNVGMLGGGGGNLGKPRRRTFQNVEMQGGDVGRGGGGPIRVNEHFLKPLAGLSAPMITTPGMGGRRIGKKERETEIERLGELG
jgi:hypothetical protein